ncbi:SCO3242 family prenyltransferase [Actinoalloteichus hymeniacidonis]|uniref:UbiA prenyltransferase family protein n=1 Tax=Actinoalloteichus hymeniacidonis TaxID=340345 RepID=A0AAC9N0X8_9PSEU|nr:UbiA family prenyltransferase [Actinoalloteichus hymeniacidonis]AOS65552.1 UbiA prenyltransferase family protein [Actinoalloteichus hymeniacidonis]MBB5906358.1 4-hydroxybenzoate polyprenyltransferase [Actinoalloteichus hymeniacidonis]
MTASERAKTLIELVRAPAGLSVLGDSIAGAAASGTPLQGRRLLLPLASVALYWSGMALNDWADRELDAVERPERPIPSGRISPNGALAVAGGLAGVGIGLSALAGGRDSARIAVALSAAIASYDTLLKPTAAGPVGMAVCRGLDVLLGAAPGKLRQALPAASAVACHTVGITALSRGEVHGGSTATAQAALAASSVAASATVLGPARSPLHRLLGAAAGVGYGRLVGRAQLAAAKAPSAEKVRAATVAGIHGTVPLQAGIAARRGAVKAAALLVGVLPAARALARRVSPT